MGERRGRRAGDLGAVVPETNVDGVLGMRLTNEPHSFFGRINAALQREAPLRIGGERRVVVVARGAKITFGVDMQANRLEHIVAVERTQEWQRRELMQVVDA